MVILCNFFLYTLSEMNEIEREGEIIHMWCFRCSVGREIPSVDQRKIFLPYIITITKQSFEKLSFMRLKI